MRVVINNRLGMVMGRIIWKLRQAMASRKVLNKDLATALGKHPTGLSRLKSQDVLPAIGSDEVERIRYHIEKLSPEYGAFPLGELIGIDEGEVVR
ncbi:MAG: XRE family transcriptional regulator [Cyanobacteria bacterium J06598_1]